MNPGTITAAVRTSVWRGPLVKGVFVLAGLAILAFAGHGAAAMVGPAAAMAGATADAGTTAESAVGPVARTAPLVVAETVITGQVPGDAGLTDRVVLNEATEADLEKLPGIGVKKAALVLALRQRLGRFHAVEDLLKVKGMGRKRLAKIRPFVTVDRT